MAVLLLVLSLIFLASHAAFSIYLFKGWDKMEDLSLDYADAKTFISIVLPFRNEEKNLPAFIQSMEAQSFDRKYFELIAVDDHSEDNGLNYLHSISSQLDFDLKIISLSPDKKSKKDALQEGIKAARGKLILTTDADVTSGPDYLQCIAFFYQSTKASMIIAPVKMVASDTWISQFQALDFLSLQLVTAAYCNQGNPILCNGANLAFEKEAFLSLNAFEDNRNIASGDDYFLLMKMRQHNAYKISFLPNADALVSTKTEKDMKSFIQQRIRWAGKTKYAGSVSLYATGLLNALFSCWLIVLPFLEFQTEGFPLKSALLLFYKLVTDYALLHVAGKKFGTALRPFYFLLSFVLYPFYICLIFMTSLIVSPRWKGREIY